MEIIKNIKILLVDNTSAIRKVVKSILKESGYHNLVEADDGRHALESMKIKPIDLIISDWDANDVKSKEFLISLRNDEKYKSMPVLIVSAEAEKEQIIEAAEFGISGYLVMPLNGSMLQDKIKKIFKGKVW